MRSHETFQFIDMKSDCFDMIISSYALWLKKEYRFLFTDCLGFKIGPDQSTLGKQIIIDKRDLIDIAMESQELKFKIVDRININSLVIFELLQEYNPIIVQLDEFNCTWRKNHNIIHRNHYILITNDRNGTGFFNCIDTYPTDYSLKLSHQEILDYAQRIICIENNLNGSIKNIDDLLIPAINKFRARDEFGTIYDRKLYFAKQLESNFDVLKEIEGYEDTDIIFTPILWKLKSLVWSWYQFEYLTEYIGNQNVNRHRNILKEIINDWEIINNIMTIKMIRKEADMMNIGLKIVKLAHKEEQYVSLIANSIK